MFKRTTTNWFARAQFDCTKLKLSGRQFSLGEFLIVDIADTQTLLMFMSSEANDATDPKITGSEPYRVRASSVVIFTAQPPSANNIKEACKKIYLLIILTSKINSEKESASN